MTAARNDDLDKRMREMLEGNNARAIAERLFNHISADYLKFNYEMGVDKVEFPKMKKIMGDYHNMLNQQAVDKITQMAEQDPKKAALFAKNLINELIRIGDMHSASAVQLAFNTVAYKKAYRDNPDFQGKIVNDERIASMEYNQALADQFLTIPYFGAYGRTFDGFKEAISLGKKVDTARDSIKKTIHDTQLATQQRRESIVGRNAPENQLMSNLKKYVDTYIRDKSTSGRKKYKASKALLMILSQGLSQGLSQEDKIKALQDFIKTVPNQLQHKNPLHKGEEHTVEKMAKDFLKVYELQVEQLKQTARRNNLQEAKNLFTQQLREESNKPAPKSTWQKANAPQRPRHSTTGDLLRSRIRPQKESSQAQDNLQNKSPQQNKTNSGKVSALVAKFESFANKSPTASHSVFAKKKSPVEPKKASPQSPHHRSRKPR